MQNEYNAKWLLSLQRLPDWLSIIGLPLSIFGFYYAINGITSAKRAAELAREAADNAKRSVINFTSVREMSLLISLLEDLKQIHRSQQYDRAFDRYDKALNLLSSIKNIEWLSEADKTTLQQSSTMIRVIEREVEANRDNTSQINITNINGLISDGLVDLRSVMYSMERRGVENNE
ncbi:hypothetical protein [uncultured Deinococcus sp.]|uniref:hypothetical protein n=1 Tax=uncultured Deinococcus sp. TaxID=158789 RepID=UPI0025D601EB|nr:hypothetical protein [uncultured Deinococcus sp.]